MSTHIRIKPSTYHKLVRIKKMLKKCRKDGKITMNDVIETLIEFYENKRGRKL